MNNGFSTPILYLAYNRPDLTAVTLQRLRELRPTRLFLAADGPRPTPQDTARTTAVRTLLDTIDWPCTITRRYAAHNQGCRDGVVSAVTWFFTHTAAGIILEDDCLPHPSFFPYADELLTRYADDPSVMHISATNPLPYANSSSYHFSRYNRIWGWATWARAWQHHDPAIRSWPEWKAQRAHHPHFPDPAERRLWEDRWDAIHGGEHRENWNHQWLLTCLMHGGKAIVPAVNLVSNLGFRPDATHTTNTGDSEAELPCTTLPTPLTHPAAHDIDDVQDRLYRERFLLPQRTTPPAHRVR
ncbi:hypothetical protein ACFRCI_30770 [Streptomyces sp. NPDC056638]|uniref:hypothetical protein n=1 Tax=Streptomyces sp. NPDC056638 TaxID=3345887 RepID=UPI00368649AA